MRSSVTWRANCSGRRIPARVVVDLEGDEPRRRGRRRRGRLLGGPARLGGGPPAGRARHADRPSDAPTLGIGPVADHQPASWSDEGARKQFHLDLACQDITATEAYALDLGVTLADPNRRDVAGFARRAVKMGHVRRSCFTVGEVTSRDVSGKTQRASRLGIGLRRRGAEPIRGLAGPDADAARQSRQLPCPDRGRCGVRPVAPRCLVVSA